MNEPAATDPWDEEADSGGWRDFASIDDAVPSWPVPVELFAQIRPVLDQRQLVRGLLPAGGLAVLFGTPGCGKSFLALDVGLHIAAARAWMSRPVTAGGVVFVGAEGQAGLRVRVEAWRRAHEPPEDIPFALIPAPLDLLDPAADLTRLSATLDQLGQRWGGIALLVIDTLAATFGGGDENGADMAAYVANVSRLCEPHQCARLIVHHQPLNADAKRPRGHGSLWGAADTVLHVQGDSGAPARRVHVLKQKDLSPAPDFHFTLKAVEVGTDGEGEPVTSCVVAAVDEPVFALTAEEQERRRRIGKLPNAAKLALQLLDDATRAAGVTPPAKIPDETLDRLRVGKVVPLDVWRDKCISAAGTERDKSRDTGKREFNRARQRLQADGIIAIFDQWAWRQW